MATMLQSESRRLYSWWWDSHISPKNSKWLQENLTDMDAKVKAMIKLIEEDADSFARRAEMYYKKRPELMKLVEEFYRAYRALAERYDHATGELRQAHRTMAEAFPNQLPFVLADDSPSVSAANETEPHTPEMPHPVRALHDPDDLHKDALGLSASELHTIKRGSGEYSAGINQKGLKQPHDIFGRELMPQKLRRGLSDELEEKDKSLTCEVSHLSKENQDLKARVNLEADRASKAEDKVENLNKTLSDIQAEKQAAFNEYQKCLEKFSTLERELNRAQNDCEQLNNEAIKAETEVQTFKGALVKLQSERDACFLKNKESKERISYLENQVSHVQEDAKGLNERAIKAEIEAQYLKNERQRLESEKEANLLCYKHSVERISDLESKLSVAEEEARLLNERVLIAEAEVSSLKIAFSKLNEEKEAVVFRYEHCLEKISKLESEIAHAQENVKLLNGEILNQVEKLKTAQEKYSLLEISNQSLLLEADNLVKKISLKDQELTKKHEELEKLQICVQEERLRHVQVEATLEALQNLHSQSQKEQRVLASELKNGLQMLKDLEVHKHGQDEEVRRLKNENESLTELNSSSTLTMKNLQDELACLRIIKERLEDEVSQQTNQGNLLLLEISRLKEEIQGLNKSFQSLMKEMESVGLSPESFSLAVKHLQYENSKLREAHEKSIYEKEALSSKLVDMVELLQKNAVLESSLSDVNCELEIFREKVTMVQDSCKLLHEEKSSLTAEKSALLSQLQIVTENMQKLMEKNNTLESSFLEANVELQRLRLLSKSLEEVCQMLHNEKCNLLAEKSTLVFQLENFEERLQGLEKRFTGLEERYSGLEKEKDFTHSQLKDLKICMGADKQEQENFKLWTQAQFSNVQNHVHFLQEESRLRKNFEEEFDRAVNAQFEVFILQKFIQDMEDKNYALLFECHRHVEASKLTDKLISELEIENLEQQFEVELLLDEIQKLRLGIYRVFKALDIASDSETENKIENEEICLRKTLGNIGNIKRSLSKYIDDNQQLLVENSVLVTLLQQLRFTTVDVEEEKNILDKECKSMVKRIQIMQNNKEEVVELNRQLKLDVSKADQHTNRLKVEMESLYVSYLELKEEYSEVVEENSSLLKKFLDLNEEKCVVDKENDVSLLDMLALDYLSAIFKSYGFEKAIELELLSGDLQNVHGINNELEKEVSLLREKLVIETTEKLHLQDSFQRLEIDLYECKELNSHLKQEVSSINVELRERNMVLLEAEQKLGETEKLNSELLKTLMGAKQECKESQYLREHLEKQIIDLAENNDIRDKEMNSLHVVNENLISEVCILHEEIEERKITEENLSSELQEISNGFEIWDTEAAAFYFDLQITSIREIFFENKVHELTGVCQNLEDESASKSLEIEQTKKKVSIMESEIKELRAQLYDYEPIILSLSNEVTSLEHNTLSRTKLNISGGQELQNVKETFYPHEGSPKELMEDRQAPTPHGIAELEKLQTRIKAVEKLLVEEKNSSVVRESLDSTINLEAAIRKIEEQKEKCSSGQRKSTGKEGRNVGREFTDSIKSQKKEPEVSEVRNGILMKDIPLDQISGSMREVNRRSSRRANDPMLVLWETDKDCGFHPSVNRPQKQNKGLAEGEIVCNCSRDEEMSGEPSEFQLEKELGVDKLEVSLAVAKQIREGNNKGKILERLVSDAQRLLTLQLTVQNLRKKLDSSKKTKRAANDIDYETVKEQLEEVDENILQLLDLNGQLNRNLEGSSTGPYPKASSPKSNNLWRKRICEQASKGSEEIGRLHLEVQKLQYLVLKMEGEKKLKAKNRFSRDKTAIVLRDFIYNGKRLSMRKKKARFCGCFRPSTSGDGDGISITSRQQ